METAADAVVSVPAGDDAGARTADLYDWQAAMAAVDGLSMFADALDSDGQLPTEAAGRIICEHHEDWAALRGSDAELVSAKHREPASGAWTTINQLVNDGGLAHLFSRWAALGGKPSVRLVTCAALAAGPPQQLATAIIHLRAEANAAVLDEAAQEQAREALQRFVKALLFQRKGLPDRWQVPGGAVASDDAVSTIHLQEARAFLSVLTIQDDRPTRTVIGHAAPSMYVQPILVRLGRPEVPAHAVWEAVLQLFRTRMRAQGPVPGGALPPVLNSASTFDDHTMSTIDHEWALSPRSVAVQDIAVAIRIALANPLGYLPLTPPARLTRLSAKMARGACADTSIERAERLRLDFRSYWRDRRNNVPGSVAERPVLERTLMRVADEATAATRTASGTWGAPLWTALTAHLGRTPATDRPDGLDDELALGQCR